MEYLRRHSVAQRYTLHELLGQGGMGAVYRAEDRLAGIEVALKQVALPLNWRAPGEGDGDSNPALALAQEFRALATLHHPHIIQVFDFGFDELRQPFFTMEYIENGLNLVEAGRNLPFPEKIRLIVQMLQALEYLHRRGILHRDLKPDNALVKNSRVRLVDFGLSVITERTVEHQTQSTAGTMAYMAPELFQGEAYSLPSDLYAVGLMAIELLSGSFPFSRTNMATMLNQILNQEVRAAAYLGEGDLAAVVDRLLVKEREERYASAAEVIRDIRAAAGLSGASETKGIRESFLRSARFVGRSSELSRLTGLLGRAAGGQGETVLIGGESGVGKSRLADELRTRALVDGFLVIDGQAVREGRNPYQLWRNVFRALSLFGHPDDDQAAVLKAAVPDIDTLLGRPVTMAGQADSPAAAKRMLTTTESVLARVNQPLLIILEDLHWAGAESIDLLAYLAEVVHSHPILLAGTFRNDRPTPLLDALDEVERMVLSRFTPEIIGQLSRSMLGYEGSDTRLVDFLERETAGNVFFVVETIRALADESGNLKAIDSANLPEKVASQGVQRLLDERLARLPQDVLPLLQMAAVYGRQLDLRLLGKLEPEIQLMSWLSTCASYAIIEPDGTRWRFAHDKLREMVLESVLQSSAQALHRRIAETIEIVYPDLTGHASELAYHWSKAGNRSKERYYSTVAGHEALANSLYTQAIAHFNRALALLLIEPEGLDRDREELSLQTPLGAAYIVDRGYAASEVVETYARAQELASKTGQAEMLFRAIWGQWQYYVHEVDFTRARVLEKELVRLAERSQNDGLLLEAYHVGWTNAFAYGDAAAMLSHAQLGRALYHPTRHARHKFEYGHDPGVCAHFASSLSTWMLGYPDRASEVVKEGMALARDIAHPYSLSLIMWARTVIARLRGEKEKTIQYAVEQNEFSQNNDFLMMSKVSQYLIALSQAESSPRLESTGQLLATAHQALEDRGFNLRLWYLSEMLNLCIKRGLLVEAQEIVDAGVSQFVMAGARLFISEWRRVLGELFLAQGQANGDKAQREFEAAIEIASSQSARSLVLRATMSLARLWHSQGKTGEARRMLQEQYDLFDEGFETADLRQARALIDRLS